MDVEHLFSIANIHTQEWPHEYFVVFLSSSCSSSSINKVVVVIVVVVAGDIKPSTPEYIYFIGSWFESCVGETHTHTHRCAPPHLHTHTYTQPVM